ncbi:MAG: hypothetical protein KJO40_18225 [Deltaproteobacteria bacterium]|nr:hypothetical protein [Deltaproteobacteria bacterium]
MKQSESRAVLAALKAAYPRQPISDTTLKVYERLLADLEGTTVVEAMRNHIKTSRFFPSVAEIRTLSLAINDVQPAELAWADVLQEVRRVGIYGTPTFSNPITGEAVGAVGWRAICNSEFIASERRCFLDAYEVVRARHQHAMLIDGVACTPALEGPAERRNEPAMLGDVVAELMPDQDDNEETT